MFSLLSAAAKMLLHRVWFFLVLQRYPRGATTVTDGLCLGQQWLCLGVGWRWLGWTWGSFQQLLTQATPVAPHYQNLAIKIQCRIPISEGREATCSPS